MPPPGSTKSRIPDETKRMKNTLHPPRVNKKLPKKPFVMPSTPSELDAEEAKNYESLARRLGNSRITNEDDAEAMRMLAIHWTRWERLCAVMREPKWVKACWVNEVMVTTKYGSYMDRRPMPEWRHSMEVDTKIMNLLGRFGMTPGDRGRVSVIDAPNKDKDAEDEFGGDAVGP